MIKKLINIVLGLLLLPLLPGFAVEFFKILQNLEFGFAVHETLVYGFTAYIVLHIVLHKPIMAYVFAHEFTHALWALPFGGRLKDFRAGESGGHAVVTRSNVLVALAPYFFPIYAYFVLALFGIFIAVGAKGKVFPYICFLTGFTVSFHLLFTGHSLLKKQSDLKRGGILLSLVLILLLNIIFITLILKVLAPDAVHFGSFFKDSIDLSVTLVLKLVNLF